MEKRTEEEKIREKFKEPCDTYYSIFVSKDIGYKYRNLSPFEFKNILIRLAQKRAAKGKEIINAGRGNPNFYSTMPRYAFSLITLISTYIGTEDTTGLIEGDMIQDLKFMPEEKGIARKFYSELQLYRQTHTGKFLYEAIETMKRISGLSPDKLIHQLVISTIGCFYPSPPRIQPFVEPVLAEFLSKTIYNIPNLKKNAKIFLTEGASAAIIYIFNSLKYNSLVVKGDTIGILTPIFSPYLEIPELQNYKLKQVCITADPNDEWEITDRELEKIANHEMKALFLCNPTNPTALSLSKRTVRKIKNIVRTKNRNLIILSDNVYAPFVGQFNSLLKALPYNTIGVYSFSKYFGVTGWRLGSVVLHNRNVIDDVLLKSVPESVNKRYIMVSDTPQNIPFIERLVLDSRQVAEGHTAGLSTPQQVIMTLFAMHDYMDKKKQYNKTIKKLLSYRMSLLLDPLEYKIRESDMNSNYYIVIDLIKASTIITKDAKFGEYLYKHRDPLEFLMLLAKRYSIVLLPGVGFAGPFWSIRVSLANLPSHQYEYIGYSVKLLVEEYYKQYKQKKRSRN